MRSQRARSDERQWEKLMPDCARYDRQVERPEVGRHLASWWEVKSVVMEWDWWRRPIEMV